MQMRQILAPTDFSQPAKQAVDYAFELAQAFGAKLILLHVIEVRLYPTGGFMPPGMAAVLLGEWERQARMDLAEVLSESRDAPVEIMRRVVIEQRVSSHHRGGGGGAGGRDRHGDPWPQRRQPSHHGECDRTRGAPGPLCCADHSTDSVAYLACGTIGTA